MTETILHTEQYLRLGTAVAAAAVGAVIGATFKRVHHLGLCVMISYAAGALLTVAFADLLPESAALSGWPKALLSALLGYGCFHFINRHVFHLCPACSATHNEINFKALSGTMIAALALHSFMDGLAVYGGEMAGHAHGASHAHEAGEGALVLLAVAVHKLPEGMALTLVARASGAGRAAALLLAIGLESVTTLSAGYFGAWALPAGSPALGACLGFIAGGFVFIVLHALLSELYRHHPRVTVLSVLAGGGSILAAAAVFGAH
ncbi:MAG: Zinc transporter ZupT [Candidatus Omnitrophica bacterium]|nr:Zinc transporter ZupT [Candidatus Omnitrophota bacterium]